MQWFVCFVTMITYILMWKCLTRVMFPIIFVICHDLKRRLSFTVYVKGIFWYFRKSRVNCFFKVEFAKFQPIKNNNEEFSMAFKCLYYNFNHFYKIHDEIEYTIIIIIKQIKLNVCLSLPLLANSSNNIP